jgi:hypothetical protein
MKIYIYLLPLLLVLACSRRVDDESMRVLLPWPNEQGVHSLQVIEVKTLRDMRKMKGDAAEIYVHPGITNTTMDGISPNAKFSKSSKGYYNPKDTITQEMMAIYAHTERLRELDQSVGIDILLAWPRKIGVQTKATDARTDRVISENAMYLSNQDVTLYFPYEKSKLPISLNSGVIAHEHFHAIFQRIVIDPLATKFNVETFGREPGNKPMTEEQLAQLETSSNNRFVLRGLNEGLADVWATIYLGQSEFLSQSLNRFDRDANALFLADQPLQTWVPKTFGNANEVQFEPLAYSLGVQYARLMRKAMEAEKLTMTNKTSQAIFVVETLTRLRDILIENFNTKISAEVLVKAIFSIEELNTTNCEWLSPILNPMNSSYKVTCEAILTNDK